MEVERQWLIKKEDIPYDLDAIKISSTEMVQMYLNFDPELRIRNYDNGRKYVMTVKTGMSSDGLERIEVEREITKEEYNDLSKAKKGIEISKRRYKIADNREAYEDRTYIQEIDIFTGKLEGFCVLEVEFPSREEAESYIPPAFAGREVTKDLEYKNCYIASCDEATIQRLIRG